MGAAVSLYQRAALCLGREDTPQALELRARVERLKDLLSDRYIAEARQWMEEKDVARAQESAKFALDVLGTDEKKREVERLIGEIQKLAAELQIEEPATQMSDDDLYETLSGSWSQPQIDEFDSYDERFKRGFLAYHAGDCETAIAAYKELLSEVGEDALYLRLEYAKALYLKAHELRTKELAEGKKEAGEEVKRLWEEAITAAEDFRNLLPPRKTPEVRAQVWNLLAQIYLDRGDPESAEEALVEAQNLLPGEVAVYLNLGRFLMSQERTDDAIAAFEQGYKVMDKLRPNVELLMLLGSAYRKAGELEKAVKAFEAIITYFMNIGILEWDPAVVLPLAQMYEEMGRVADACDMYRHLSTCGDRENLGSYNYNAARLMKKLGRSDEEIIPFILRAKEFAGSDADLRRKIEEL